MRFISCGIREEDSNEIKMKHTLSGNVKCKWIRGSARNKSGHIKIRIECINYFNVKSRVITRILKLDGVIEQPVSSRNKRCSRSFHRFHIRVKRACNNVPG